MNKRKIKVLLVEDNHLDARIIKEELKESRTINYDLNWVEEVSTAIKCLSEEVYDVILSDLSLPDSNGLDTLNKIYKKNIDTPLIVLTGLDDEEIGIKAVQEGAQDYLVKNGLSSNLLTHSVLYAIERHKILAYQKEIDKLRTEFINIVSHEIRNPLNGIIGCLELIKNMDLSEEKKNDYLSMIYNETNRLNQLVSDFLDAQRLESGRYKYDMEFIKLADLINEVILIFSEYKTHEIKFENDESIFTVYVDRDRIKQVLINLISNAIKYSPSGGQVKIKIQKKSTYIEISVEDEGLGIPEVDANSIFQKFFRVNNAEHRKVSGSGLGLSICKEIVSAHGGNIWIESVLGKGSKFYFTLQVV